MNYDNYIISLCLEGGYSILPIQEGNKNPHYILGKNHKLLEESSSPEDIKLWVDAGVTSFAVACGRVSGNLVVLDFDDKYNPGFFETWKQNLSEELKEIINQCVITKTRNNGYHVIYRTENSVPTVKLASIKSETGTKCFVEIRGEGSYVLIPPSVGYTTIQNELLNIQTLKTDVHDALVNSITKYNQVPEPKIVTEAVNLKTNNSDTRPGDLFNRDTTWSEILTPHGWTEVSKDKWKRPGKDVGCSATTGHDGHDILYVFSSNATLFESEKGYTKFTAHTLLNHGGDFKVSAQEVAKQYPELLHSKTDITTVSYDLDKYKPLLWSEINDWKFTEASWWIKDLIPKNAFVIIASISGEGKSWSAYTMAKNLSEGQNFLNKEDFQTNQGTVLYIDAENSPKEIQRRCRQLGYSDNNRLLFLPVSDFNLNNEIFANKLKCIIAENKVDVVIVDTFRAVAGGLDENQANIVRQFFNKFKENRDNGTSFVFLDHYRKPNHFEGKVPRKEFLFGSQDKTAGVEVLLMLKKEGDTIELHQAKNRVGKEISPFTMELIDSESDTGEISTKLVYASELDPEVTKKDTARLIILGVLGNGPLLRVDLIMSVKKNASVGEKSIDSALKEMMADGVLTKGRDGKKDLYTLVKVEQSENTETVPF